MPDPTLIDYLTIGSNAAIGLMVILVGMRYFAPGLQMVKETQAQANEERNKAFKTVEASFDNLKELFQATRDIQVRETAVLEEELRQVRENAATRVEALEAQIETLREQVTKRSKEVQELTAKVQELEGELQQKQRLIDTGEEKRRELKEQLEEEIAARKRWENKSTNLQAQVTGLKRRLDAVEANGEKKSA